MTNTFNELDKYIEYISEEVHGLEAAIKYTEQFLMDDSPEFYAKHIAEMKDELAKMVDEMKGATEYAERLAAY